MTTLSALRTVALRHIYLIKKYVYPIAHACTVQVEKGMCFACELYSAAAPARRARASTAYDPEVGVISPPDSADEREMGLVGIGHTDAAATPRLFLPGWLLGYRVLSKVGNFRY